MHRFADYTFNDLNSMTKYGGEQCWGVEFL